MIIAARMKYLDARGPNPKSPDPSRISSDLHALDLHSPDPKAFSLPFHLLGPRPCPKAMMEAANEVGAISKPGQRSRAEGPVTKMFAGSSPVPHIM